MPSTPSQITLAHIGSDRDGTFGVQQPFFSFASVDITDAEAENFCAEWDRTNRIDVGLLVHTDHGRAVLDKWMARLEGRYLVSLQDKRELLAERFVEEVCAPVIRKPDAGSGMAADKQLSFYRAALSERMADSGEDLNQCCAEIDYFISSLNYEHAPTFFAEPACAPDQPVGAIKSFIELNWARIRAVRRSLPDTLRDYKLAALAAYAAMGLHIEAWSARNESLDFAFVQPSDLLELIHSTEKMRVGGAVEDTSFLNRYLGTNALSPIKLTPLTSNVGFIAKAFAAMASYAALHPEDDTYDEIRAAMRRHSVPGHDLGTTAPAKPPGIESSRSQPTQFRRAAIA